jgi:predicted ATPase/class 3 adenylate cyclase
MNTVEREPSAVVIRLFGPFELLANGCPLPRLRTRKGQWLLALLAMRAGRELDRAWLASTLWPDSSPTQAFVNLRVSLNDLRRVLGAADSRPVGWDRLCSPTGRTLCLDLTGAEVDVVAFDEGIACGALAALERAVSLYRGPLLEECAEEWVFLERRTREQAYLQALERLAADALERGELGAAERHLRRAVAVDPLRESAQRGLMQALAKGDNFAAATQVYRELRLLLHRELNGEPDSETTALYERIRAEARGKAVVSAQVPARGESASARAPSREAGAARREIPEGTVTLLLTDIEGSTKLWLEHSDAMRRALARHDELLTASIEHHGGDVLKQRGEGDSCFAVFSRATDAVVAALALQRALALEPWPAGARLQVRVALHTGEAELREGDYFGPAVNHCARLRAIGHGGQTLLSQTTAALAREELPEGMSLRDLGAHRLKDLQRPEPIFQLVHADLPADFPPLRGLDAGPNNLAVQRTLLIGREEEVTAVRQLLLREDASLVTLTGPGGTGKTRLALQVAADLIDAFTDGVFFVDLAPIRDPGLVASAIAQTLGVRETGGQPLLETLKSFLRAKSFLLVLDNFEQVLDAGPTVAELLAAAPRLKVLVTSRAALRLRGEKEFAVLPLALPDLKRLPPAEALSQYAAVGLFVQRALDVKPDFGVTSENAPVVAEICHRLDGLPLALELAAARVKLFSPQALLSRLENRFKLLTGGARDLPARQQTLRDAIGWSYDLLNEREKALFRRLSVFVGGCTLEAAEAVATAPGECAGEGGDRRPPPLEIDILDGIASLVEKSLIHQQHGAAGEPRFSKLETIREYAWERLEESGETEAVRRQHGQFFLALVETAEAKLVGAEQGAWLDRLEGEHDNFRAVLAWSQTEAEDGEIGLRLAGALWWFWWLRCHWTEARNWLAGVLTRSGGSGCTAGRAKALEGAGLFASDWEVGRRLGEQSVAVFRELGDKLGLASSLRTLALRLEENDDAAARLCYEESLAICQEAGDRRGEMLSRSMMGSPAHLEGDVDEEAVAFCREVGNQWNLGWLLLNLGHRAKQQGDRERAYERYKESLAIFRELGNQSGVIYNMESLAMLPGAQQEPERVARLFGAAATLRDAISADDFSSPDARADYERRVSTIRAALGEEAFAAAWEAGRAMSLEEAVRVALEDEAPQ